MSAHHQSLQIKLGSDAQEQINVQRIVVRGERLGHGAAGDGMHHRRLHLDKAVVVEEAPQRLHYLGALDENLAHLGIHRQVHVTAAIARFHILQSVPFLRQRKQVLHQEGDLLDVNGELAGAGAEEIALHPDVVAEVQQLIKREALLADRVQAHVNLQPLAMLLQMGKPRLALQADGHQPAGHGDRGALRLQVPGRSSRHNRLEFAGWNGWLRSGRDMPAAPAPQSASACLCAGRRFSGRVPQCFLGPRLKPGQWWKSLIIENSAKDRGARSLKARIASRVAFSRTGILRVLAGERSTAPPRRFARQFSSATMASRDRLLEGSNFAILSTSDAEEASPRANDPCKRK